MIGKAIASYKKIQMDLIGKMSVGNEDIIFEVPFFDEGFINAMIERLKREYDVLATEMKIAKELNTEYEIQKQQKLQQQMDIIETKIVHYAVNSFKALPLCRELMKNKNLKIEGLIDALECYQDNDKNRSVVLFYEYFRNNRVESAYYLGNKIYGKLLMDNERTEEGVIHLEYAVQLRANDTELLNWLKEAYLKLDRQFEARRVEEVLEILG